MLQTVQKVVTWAISAKQGTQQTRRMPMMILLDICTWDAIMSALMTKGISAYLRRQIAEYLSERWIAAEIQGRVLSSRFSEASLPRISPGTFIMVTGLWLCPSLQLPPETNCGFCRRSCCTGEQQNKGWFGGDNNTALAAIATWMQDYCLELAPQKCVYIILTSRQKASRINVRVGGQPLQGKDIINYLGVQINMACKFSLLWTDTKAQRKTEDAKYADVDPDSLKGIQVQTDYVNGHVCPTFHRPSLGCGSKCCWVLFLVTAHYHMRQHVCWPLFCLSIYKSKSEHFTSRAWKSLRLMQLLEIPGGRD